MKPIICALLLLVSTVIRSRVSLQLEILALRHQLAVYRFLSGANREKQGVVCFGGPRTSSSQGYALQCHGTSDRSVDRSADH
jgi:hypothetical protein